MLENFATFGLVALGLGPGFFVELEVLRPDGAVHVRADEFVIFDPAAVAKLVEKCRSGRAIGFADNMAFVGILSTMCVDEMFIRRAPEQMTIA